LREEVGSDQEDAEGGTIAGLNLEGEGIILGN
jgi:hypothetical protein